MSLMPRLTDSLLNGPRSAAISAVIALSVGTVVAITPAHSAVTGAVVPARVGVTSIPAPSSAHALIRTIPLPSQGRAVGVGSGIGAPIYIAAGDNFGGQLLRIDPQTLAQTGSVAVGNYPKGLAVSADDTVYVVNADSDTMSVVKGSTMTVSATVNTYEEPQYVGLSRTSDDTIFVSSSGFGGTANRITSINARTLTLGPYATLGAGASPYGLAVGPDDSVYVSSYGASKVYQYGPRTNVVSDAFTGAQGPIGVAIASNNTIYFSQEAGNLVTRFPVNSPGSATSISVSDPQGIAISADDTVYVAGRMSRLISIIDPQAFTVDDSVSLSGQPLSVAVTRSGLVVTANSNGNAAWIIAPVQPTLGAPTGQSGATGTLTLEGLPTGVTVDDTTVKSIRFGDDTAPWTRTAGTNTFTGPIPSGTGTVEVTVSLNGGNTASAGAFTYFVPPPTPPAPTPADAPRDVLAVAGDASASVSWTSPASSGSFPVSHYLATSTPGAHTCLVTAPTLTCGVSGLTNGTAYTFTVKALTGAGWSASSAPSNVVVPRPQAKPSIVITGSREGSRIDVSGSSNALGMGGMVTPWTSKGRSAYIPGREVLVSVNGTFTWSRQASPRAMWRVYFTAEDLRSNTVTVRAR